MGMLLLGPLGTDQAKRFFIVYTNPNPPRSIPVPPRDPTALIADVDAGRFKVLAGRS